MTLLKTECAEKATIVVVDDEPFIVEALVYVLEDEGYQVFSAKNGRAALALVAEVKPALVISDFMMPVMSGLELAEAMKADPALRAIPIILASAVHARQARERGELFAAIFEKPYRLAQLLNMVSTLMKADPAP